MRVKESKSLRLALFLSITSVYIATVHKYVPGGDSAELIAAAYSFGLAHPPGYPLYCILVYFFTRIFPFGSVAFKANVLSTFMSGTSQFLMFLVMLSISQSLSSSLLFTGLFAFTPLVWYYSVTAEVFALNNVLISLLLYSLWLFATADTRKKRICLGCLCAFVCGLGLCNQHTSVLFAFPVALFVGGVLLLQCIRDSQLLKFVQICVLEISSFLFGSLPQLYLPFATSNAVRTSSFSIFGDARDLKGFLRHLLREDYGTFRLSTRQYESNASEYAYKYLVGYLDESRYLGGFACLGILLLFCRYGLIVFKMLKGNAKPKIDVVRERTSSSLVLSDFESQRTSYLSVILVCFCFYLVVFAVNANIPFGDELLFSVQQRFWMQPNVVLYIFSAFALSYLFRLQLFSKQQTIIAAVCIAVACYQVSASYDYIQKTTNENTVLTYGRESLRHLPEKSLLLAYRDSPTFQFLYLQQCEKYRKDILLIIQPFMNKEWYLPTHGKRLQEEGVEFPGNVHVPLLYRAGEQVLDPGEYSMRQFILANYDKFPIFIAGGFFMEDNSIEGQFELQPFGFHDRIVRTDVPVNVVDYIESSRQFIVNRSDFEDILSMKDSWSKSVSQEYFRSYTRRADYLYKIFSVFDRQDDAFLMLANETARAYEEIPSSIVLTAEAYKRIGLCYREMLKVLSKQGSDVRDLVEKMKQNFVMFLHRLDEKKLTDPQREIIEKILRYE